MNEMYTGKSSRNPYMPLIYLGLMGVVLIAFGIYEYKGLAAWEVTTDPDEIYEMHAILWGIYDLGGKNAVLGTLVTLGFFCLYGGWHKSQELKKLKDDAIH